MMRPTMRYGIDVSSYTALPDLADMTALVNSERLELLIAASDVLGVWSPYIEQFGLEAQAYQYLYNSGHGSYEQQIDELTSAVQNAPVGVSAVWLDVEDATGILPTGLQLFQAVEYAQSKIRAPVGIYTRADYWQSIGNPQLGRVCPLWDANWSSQKPYQFDVDYGGWLRATVKQIAGDYTSYGITVDLDVWDN